MGAESYKVDIDEIWRTLGILLEPGTVTELRVLPSGADGVLSGYYSERAALVRDAAYWSGRARAVFMALNPVKPLRLAWAANRLRWRALDETDDADIQSRRWLPIDLDPCRPPGTNSTDAEHELALAGAYRLRAWLRALHWPEPVRADSGDGAHLLYRLNLPNNADTTRLVERGLAALDLRFSSLAVTIDASVANAARLWKLYGTLAAKGEHTAARPQRLARLLEVPRHLEPVAPGLLAALPTTGRPVT